MYANEIALQLVLALIEKDLLTYDSCAECHDPVDLVNNAYNRILANVSDQQ